MDYRGVKTNFYGNPVAGKMEDVPIGAGSSYYARDISSRLPRYLCGRYELVSFEPHVIDIDPVVIRNQWHQIIYQWPDGYIPDWVDVLSVCKQLGLK